jgi:transposase
MSGKVHNRGKIETLKQHGTLNPHPQKVTHELFHHSDFFDPRDLLQVKYEMLRQVRIEDRSVSQAATTFGFSRPSFYQAQAAFQQAGLAGLIPQKRGPRHPHKLTPEVLAFLQQMRTEQPALSTEELVQRVGQRFDIRIHPRTIERSRRRQKKRR